MPFQRASVLVFALTGAFIGSAGLAAKRTLASNPGLSLGVVSRMVRITPARPKAGKPTAPVKIELVAGPVQGQSQRARLVVTPTVDAARLDLDIQTMEGLTLTGGRAHWQGPARRLQRVFQDVRLSAGGPEAQSGRQRLIVTATLTYPGDQEANPPQSAVAAWSARSRAVSLQEAHPGARKVQGRGGKSVIEIPAGESTEP